MIGRDRGEWYGAGNTFATRAMPRSTAILSIGLLCVLAYALVMSREFDMRGSGPLSLLGRAVALCRECGPAEEEIGRLIGIMATSTRDPTDEFRRDVRTR